MVKFLFKYSAVIFLFNTILMSIGGLIFLGNLIFLALMGIFLFVLLINPKQIKAFIFHKAFSFLLIINLINLLYFLVFHSISDLDALKYLCARFIQFTIISSSIYFNYEYYKSRFLIHITYIIAFIVLIGLVLDPNIFASRYSGIIWNPNMLSSLTSLAFSILLLRGEKRTKFELFLLFIFLIVSLSTGSRGVLIAIFLVFLLKFGISVRNILYSMLFFIFYLLVLNFNLDTSINRFSEQSLFNDRILQFKYAYLSIKENLFTGYGLDKYAFIDMSLVPSYLKDKVIGSHNGYLAIFTQYGIIFGGIILFLIFQKSLQALTFLKVKNSFEMVYLFIIIYTLLACLYETYITGINEFQTILFWFSLSFLSYTKFKKEYEV